MKLFWNVPDHIPLIKREELLEPKRVMSVFKERIEKHKVELEELESLETTLETQIPPNIIWENPETVQGHAGDAGNVYYEQYTIPGPITLRRGDAVFVRAETGKNLIAQIGNGQFLISFMTVLYTRWLFVYNFSCLLTFFQFQLFVYNINCLA